MAKNYPNSGKKDPGDELMALAGGALLVFAMFGFAIWLTGSARIISATAHPLFLLARPYALFEAGQVELGRLAAQGGWLLANPRTASLGQFVTYLNACLKPLAGLVAAVMVVVVAWVMFVRKVPSLNRRLSSNPPRLLKILSEKFPGVIPVMHLGDQLILDKLPAWRRQTWPEEVFLRTKVGGRLMSQNGKLDDALVTQYFKGTGRGITHALSPRLYSRMLGIHVVNVVKDAGRGAASAGAGPKLSSVVFADRMSPEGKVMFALLCAHAFGDKADYWKAMRQLNESCAGHPLGLPNLTVAQWCFDKYRTNPTAHALFAVHHWEYSYLYALFFLAKRQGKVTHREWLWLKPLNRILFYCLNTVLRKTPPVEAATCWAQYGYERQVARLQRLPITPSGDPIIMTLPAERAFRTEFDHYSRGSDSDDDAWWKDSSVWKRSAAAMSSYRAAAAAPATPDTAFDREQQALEAQAQQGRAQLAAEEISRLQNENRL